MLAAPPRLWWRRPIPKRRKNCYRSKSDALRLFIEENRRLIDHFGGESMPHGAASFDAINAKYGLRGKKRATTIAEALWAALPSRRPPYCLTDLDLNALNDTQPAREAADDLGISFRLPSEALVEDYPEAPPELPKPPKNWRARCRRWFRQEKARRINIASDCYYDRHGNERCVCRDAHGAFVRCVEVPGVPF